MYVFLFYALPEASSGQSYIREVGFYKGFINDFRFSLKLITKDFIYAIYPARILSQKQWKRLEEDFKRHGINYVMSNSKKAIGNSDSFFTICNIIYDNTLLFFVRRFWSFVYKFHKLIQFRSNNNLCSTITLFS